MRFRKKYIIVSILLIAIISSLIFSKPFITKLYGFSQNLRQKMEVWGLVLTFIERHYFKDIDSERLVEDSIDGLLSSLDPHTVYLSKSDFEKWQADFRGYFGVGISYDIIQNKITVLSVNEYGPASKVGLKPGDRIIKINDDSAIGMKREEVPLKIMGPAGSTVRVTIERKEWDKPREFIVPRQHVATASVPYSFLIRPDIGYIRIARFTATTVAEFEIAVDSLLKQGMKKIILDLRGNQGGYLQAAEGIVDRFIPAGKVIVYTKGRIDSYNQETISTDDTITPLLPLIILIDHVSASGSEIVAGAVQDWDRGLIIGLTSFGKGLVQRQFGFKDGSALLATIAAYYTPSGRLIQRDFSKGSRQEYFMDPFVSNEIDSATTKPVFHTSLGRTVHGGGGISPDIKINPTPSRIAPAVRKLYFADEKFFYIFCESWANSYPEIGNDIEEFLNKYKISAKMYSDFVTFIQESGFNFSQDEFAANKEEILFRLKHELAFTLWGDMGRFRVLLSQDQQLWQALEHFTAASQLLESKDFSDRQLMR